MKRHGASIAAVIALAMASPSLARAETTASATVLVGRRPLPGGGGATAVTGVKRNAVGALAEVFDGPPAGAKGLGLRVGFGFEHAADCAWSAPRCPFPGGGGSQEAKPGEPTLLLSTDRIEYAAHARIGWDFRWVALEAGAFAYTDSITYVDPSRRLLTKQESRFGPDVALRIGVASSFIAVGYGVSTPPTMFYPGPFVRGHVDFGGGRWGTSAVVSVPRFGRDEEHYRGEIQVTFRLTKRLTIGDALALMHGTMTDGTAAWTGEVRLIAGWTFDVPDT